MEQEIIRLIESDLFSGLTDKQQVVLHKLYIEKKDISEIASDFDEDVLDTRMDVTKAVEELKRLDSKSKQEPKVTPAVKEPEQPIFEIVVKESQLNLIKQESDKIIINNNAEIHLMRLLELQKLVEDTLAYCKERLAAKAAEIDPDFKAVVSDNLKIMYRAYGSKYGLDESQIDSVPRELLTETMIMNADKVREYCIENDINFEQFLDSQYSLDTKALDKYMKKNTTLPLGIIEIDRKKQLSITLKKAGAKDGE